MVYGGQTAGSELHVSGVMLVGVGCAYSRELGRSLPATGSGSAQTDRHEAGFRCTFPSTQQQTRAPYIPETKSSGRVPKPRASHRIPNFRNETGTCLSKVNLAPSIHFCRCFAVVEAGRSARASGHLTCCPPG